MDGMHACETAALNFFSAQNGGGFFGEGVAVRRCLNCQRMIRDGSRCAECQRAYRPSQKRWAAAVKCRDGYRCVICGSTDRIEAHHIVPVARGGALTLANGQTLCHAHHVAITEGRAA